MINSFENYLREGKIKKKTPDFEEASALLRKAFVRIKYVQGQKMTDETAEFFLEDAYEAIRESTQSKMSLHGFKPYSHEATISFLKKYYHKEFTEEDIAAFDRYRKLRNDAVYRAVPVTKEEAQDCLTFAITFLNKVKSLK